MFMFQPCSIFQVIFFLFGCLFFLVVRRFHTVLKKREKTMEDLRQCSHEWKEDSFSLFFFEMKSYFLVGRVKNKED